MELSKNSWNYPTPETQPEELPVDSRRGNSEFDFGHSEVRDFRVSVWISEFLKKKPKSFWSFWISDFPEALKKW